MNDDHCRPPRLAFLCETQGKKVFIVDGDLLRTTVAPDFMVAGHHYLYPHIPQDEIWVDSMIPPDDWDCAAFNELVETYLIEHGVDPKKASEMADDFEEMFRVLEPTEETEAYMGGTV